MTRYLLCNKCAAKCAANFRQVEEDYLEGWRMRRTPIDNLKKPDKLQTVITEYGNKHMTKVTNAHIIDHEFCVCDHCNKKLADGCQAAAVTMWNVNSENEPLEWSKDYQ